MKLSIIVPIYNISKYLKNCLDSILSQSFTDFELLLVDDGSTDGSAGICDNYAKKDSRIRVFHKINRGLSSARNLGIEKAKGEYLFFVDGDDFLPENSLHNISEGLKSNPDILVSKVFKLVHNEELTEEKFELHNDLVEGLNGAQALESLIKNINTPLWQAWRNVIKTEFMKKYDFQFLSGLTSEDMHLIPQIYLQAESVSVCNKPTYVYRIDRSGSIMNTESFKRYKDFFFIVKYWLNFFEKEQCPETLKPVFESLVAKVYFYYVTRIYKFSKKERNLLLADGKEFKFLLKSKSLSFKNRLLFAVLGYRGMCKFYAYRNGTKNNKG